MIQVSPLGGAALQLSPSSSSGGMRRKREYAKSTELAWKCPECEKCFKKVSARVAEFDTSRYSVHELLGGNFVLSGFLLQAKYFRQSVSWHLLFKTQHAQVDFLEALLPIP